MQSKTTPKDIEEYLAMQPESMRPLLEKLWQTILKAAPKAEEVISYQMPAFKYHGPLVYFALFKKHIGFFPTSTPIPAFKKELTNYKCSKGTIQFPLDQPIPWSLVSKIVKFKVKENKLKSVKRKKL